MIPPQFAILGALVSLVGTSGYVLDTLRGRTQPNRVSWTLWAIAPLIAFAAELTQHVGLPALMTFAVGFGPAMVMVASFVDPRAYWHVTRIDLLCGALSIVALAMWAITGQGNVAIAFAILSDLWAGIPTVRKAHTHPASESVKAFIGGVAGGTITLLALPAGEWTFARFGFPLYILLFDATISVLILRPRGLPGPPPRGAPGGGEAPLPTGSQAR